MENILLWGETMVINLKKYDVSPTVSLEYIMITSEIEAHEERYFATIYIPGAFLHTYSHS